MSARVDRYGFKTHLLAGGKAVNGWCSIPSPVTAEIVARAGFDSVSIDLQHGLIDYAGALNMLQAVDILGVPTLARVPWNEPGIIMKLLDAGVGGIICPMINTRAEAEQLVAATRYAPMGGRSFGPTRAIPLWGSDYVKRAGDLITVFAMIETRQALNNLDDILTVEGIDGVYVGPADLGLSLGYQPTLLPTDKEVQDGIATILSKANAAGKLAAIHCGSPEMAADMLEKGFSLASLMTDVRILTAALGEQLAQTRKAQHTDGGKGGY